MTKTALITGATGGLGREFAAMFAKHGFDLVLTGRNEQKLEKVREYVEGLGAKCLAISADLRLQAEQESIFTRTLEKGIEVDVLVNNAGFGDFGRFSELDAQKQHDMIQVNIAALVRLTRLFLPGMIKRGGGRILNVASIAAYQPGPLMACYYASKAFVLSFSEALSVELEGTGVTVTALCPGTTDTGFEEHASLEGRSMLFDSLKPVQAGTVAEYGYRALMKGKRVAVPGTRNKVMTFFGKVMPQKLTAKAALRIQRRVSKAERG